MSRKYSVFNFETGEIEDRIVETEAKARGIPFPKGSANEIAPLDVQLAYEKSNGEIHQYTLTLIAHMEKDGKKYVRARDHSNGAIKSFRLDRMQKIVAIDTGELIDAQKIIS